jgi:hypothetical protein
MADHGRDPHANPFVDVGFVDVEGARLARSRHRFLEPLWVDSAPQALSN